MSGTSLDGLDLAYCIFIKKNNSWKFELKFVEFIEYDLIWKKKNRYSTSNVRAYDITCTRNTSIN